MADRPGPAVSLRISGAGTELCWIYAWALFFSEAVLHRGYPLLPFLAAFVLAAGITAWCRGRGWRMAAIIGCHLFFLGLVFRFNLQALGYPGRSAAFLSLPASPSGIEQWFSLLLAGFSVGILWTAGIRFVRLPLTHLLQCTRMDIGVGSFALLIFLQHVVHIPVAETDRLLLLFFFFSLAGAIFTADAAGASRMVLPGYRRTSGILTFSAIGLALSAAAVMIGLPLLTAAAETGNDWLSRFFAIVSPGLIRVLKWIFGPTVSSPAGGSASLPGAAPSTAIVPPGSHWVDLVIHIAAWIAAAALLFLLLILVAVMVWASFQWLASRSGRSENRWTFRDSIRFWRLRFQQASDWIRSRWKGKASPAALYRSMLTLGRMAGTSRLLDETPNEYQARLTTRFPALSQDIELIGKLYQKDAYGGSPPAASEMRAAREARRRMFRRLLKPIHGLRRSVHP